MTRDRSSNLRGLLLASLLLHGMFLGLSLLWQRYAPTWRPPAQHVISTKLVRLGTPRPKELLPRLPEPKAATVAETPPPVPPPPPAASPPPAAPPRQAPPAAAVALPNVNVPRPPRQAVTAPPATNRARPNPPPSRRSERTNQALQRLKRVVAGQKDGSLAGDQDVAVDGDAYASEVERCIRENYAIEGYSREKVSGLEAQMLLFIDASGAIVRYQLEKRSGNTAFDVAVGRAVSRCHKISPPPLSKRDKLRREGIEIVFRP